MNKNKKTSKSNETRKGSQNSSNNSNNSSNNKVKKSASKIDSDSSKSYRTSAPAQRNQRNVGKVVFPPRSPEKTKRTRAPNDHSHSANRTKSQAEKKESENRRQVSVSPVAQRTPVHEDQRQVLYNNLLVPHRESHRSLIGLDGESDVDTDEHSPRPADINRRSPVPPSPDRKDSSEAQEESISLAENEKGLSKYRFLFKEFAAKSQKIHVDEVTEDFTNLPCFPLKEECVSFHNPANAKKNRYKDIPCLEMSRVKLHFMSTKEPGADYIHANFVTSRFLQVKYILTQGPKKNTVVDFWRMVWQEKSTAIVMLCQFVEHTREKCAEYFPSDQKSKLRFDRLELSYIDSTRDRMVLTTKLKLEYKGEARTVTHYQWMEWPDYQVPGSSDTMLRLLRKIRAKKMPPVIHCAAGVGRSGTFMAIEIALMMIHNYFELPDIRQIVASLRSTGRSAAVQTLQQYLLIRKVVLDFGVSNRLITEESFDRYTATYNRALGHQNTS